MSSDLSSPLRATSDTAPLDIAAAAQTGDPLADVFTAQRPWGHFQQFVQNRSVTVKIITVQPGHRLSLQRHGHRHEMWHVLDVPIYVEVGDSSWVAQVGQQVWVPSGSLHRMSNESDRAGRLLEIAFGDFDEADIERIQDDYARAVEDVRGSAGAPG